MSTPQSHASRRFILAICALVTLSLLGQPAVAQAPPAGDPGVAIDLEGPWRFATGDDLAWAEPGFDDSAWEEVQVPTDGGQAIFADYDGFAWFRLTFDLPAGIDGVNLVASMGFIDDADETYLNGVSIGRTGVLPDVDSQWFERRLYPVPADAPVFGGTNVLAVRMNDFSGGGGWYRGPVGLFSKSALREAVYGITGQPAPAGTAQTVQDLLDRQATALAAGDVQAYLDTLADSYVHDGRSQDRRGRDLTAWLEESGTLALTDSEVEVIAADDGRLLVDTNRLITGTRDGEPFAFQPASQEFLVIDPVTGLETGNRSRFFRDLIEPGVEGKRREYVMYLPPSYYTSPDHAFPTVYLLHGVNGGSREWEPRDFQARLDELFTSGGLAEMIVVMPDAESLWYIDSSVTPWRSMFIDEMLPQVDAEYRTLAQREFRGLSGVSMGGHGAFTVGWSNPELFSSIASHMGALSLPPLVGSAAEIAANTPETPLSQVTGHTPEFLSSFGYYFDACADDDFRFGEAVEAMDGQMTSKMVEHTAIVFPEGRHNDDCWLPHIDASFGLHSDSFRASGLVEPPPAPEVAAVAVRRLAGQDRIATAVALSAEGYAQADAVVLASAADFPDALTAGPLAMAVQGPLLLSEETTLSPAVADELERLGARTVYLAGGESALSPAIQAELTARGLDVVRLAGADRYATATAIAAQVVQVGGPADGVILARGDDFADALAASSLASTGVIPVLLSRPDGLPSSTSAGLQDLLDTGDTVTLAGGEAALSDAVRQQVADAGFSPDRRGGADRYATAAALRQAAATRGGGGLVPLVIASGTAFPDALGAGVLAARLGGGLLLVDPLDLRSSPASATALQGLDVGTVRVAGGTAAVSAAVIDQVVAALRS